MLLLSLGEIRMCGVWSRQALSVWGRKLCKVCGVQTWAQPRIQSLGGVIPRDRKNRSFPEAAPEALSLFENQEQLGQAIQWHYSELQKLEQKERE